MTWCAETTSGGMVAGTVHFRDFGSYIDDFKRGEPIELIAQSIGFVDPERMRRAFIRVTGHPPQSIRRMASCDAAHCAA